MVVRLQLEVFGDKQLDRNLMRFGERVVDLRPPFTVIADDFLELERQQFETQGAFASGGWAPLKEETIAAKERLGLDTRILHATLALRNSLTQRGAPGQVRRIAATEMTVGTSVTSNGFPYPAAHQNPQRGQRRRRPIELRAVDRIRWVKIVQRWVVTGALSASGQARDALGRFTSGGGL